MARKTKAEAALTRDRIVACARQVFSRDGVTNTSLEKVAKEAGVTRIVELGAGKVREDQFTESTTMYGCNKLYCEHLGRYYSRHYQQLAADVTPRVDFRSVRFPGLISAVTLPAGGTSDYAPEMIHAAASRQP